MSDSLKHKNVWLLLYCVVTVLCVIPVFEKSINAWTASFWFFDYEYGFIKRGFIAQLRSLICTDVCTDISIINNINYVVVVTLSFLLCLFVFLFYQKNRLPGLAFLIAGFSIQQFVLDIGRFDQINYIVLLCSIFLIVFIHKTYVICFFVVLLNTLMLVIHEASIMMHIPVVIAAFLLKVMKEPQYGRMDVLWVFVAGLLSIVTLFLILSLGTLSDEQAVSFAGSIGQEMTHYDEEDRYLISDAAKVMTRSVAENYEMTMSIVLKKKTISRVLMILGVSIPFIFIFFKVGKQLRLKGALVPCCLLIPAVAVLPLFLVAYDWYRWLSMIMFNTMLIIGVAAYLHNIEFEINRKLSAFAVLFSVYSGPYGITLALPERSHLVEYIRNLFV